jgi:hypothetical protein
MPTNVIFCNSSRDIWSHGGGRQLRDLLASALSTLLLMEDKDRPVYISSPWISNFVLFQNHYREFEALFPDMSDRLEFRFSDYLKRLARKLPVRIITTKNDISEAFLANFPQTGLPLTVRYHFAKEEYHEKGLLAPSFYIEGSMNFTYRGVYVSGEKITYHCGLAQHGAQKILKAYLEFERRWNLLEKSE